MDQKIYYNALTLATKSSYSQLEKIRDKYGNWSEAWKELCHKYKDIDPEQEFEKLQKNNITLILGEDKDFPPLLTEIPLAPFGIYIKGSLPVGTGIAVVGTRGATTLGKKIAENFSEELARSGVDIISGLAIGIDAVAHQGALNVSGKTVAVLARGLDGVYPSIHSNLAEKIIEGEGALISEYPIGSPTLPYRFMERNRIVSGLSKGTLVIEAPSRSGAMATARFALEQNREIWVVPGPLNEKNYEGSHKLIQQGAMLVTKAQDILENLGIEAKQEVVSSADFSPEEKTMFDILRKAGEPLSVDKICLESNLDSRVVSKTITYLIMKKVVTETPHGFIITKL